MDIFNRKKLAQAEADIRRQEKINQRQYNELQVISDKLCIAENECRKYKQMHNEDKEIIEKLKQENSALDASCQIFANKLNANKINCSASDNRGSPRNQEFNNANKEIEDLKRELKEAEAVISVFLEQSEDIDIVEDNSRTKNAAYVIRNELVEGKIGDNKKAKHKFVASLYKSCNSFFSPNELKAYEMLSDLVQKKGFFLFSKVRLADIIEMWEKFYDEESMEKAKKQNPYENGTAFLNALSRNSFKKQVYDRIQKLNPDFNDSDYRTAFLYPLLRLHIDFLLCRKIENNIVPLLAIELNGEEHYNDWIKINNDNFKKSVFFSDYVYIGFLSIFNDVLNNEEDKLRKVISDVIDGLSNKEMLNTWKGIQDTLNRLAKPYMEKLGK